MSVCRFIGKKQEESYCGELCEPGEYLKAAGSVFAAVGERGGVLFVTKGFEVQSICIKCVLEHTIFAGNALVSETG
jgi:hypothetical protein